MRFHYTDQAEMYTLFSDAEGFAMYDPAERMMKLYTTLAGAIMARLTELQKLRSAVLNADNHYAVLGVATGAATDVIKAAHRTLARAFHPDLSKLEDAHELCARVNVAYAVLGDKEARRKYDAVERTEEAQCTRCAGTGTVYKQKGFNKKVQSPCPVCGGHGVCASQSRT